MGRVPAHADVHAEAEEIAGGLGEEHFGGDGESAGRAGGVGGDGAEGEVGGFENGREGYFLNDRCSWVKLWMRVRGSCSDGSLVRG